MQLKTTLNDNIGGAYTLVSLTTAYAPPSPWGRIMRCTSSVCPCVRSVPPVYRSRKAI